MFKKSLVIAIGWILLGFVIFIVKYHIINRLYLPPNGEYDGYNVDSPNKVSTAHLGLSATVSDGVTQKHYRVYVVQTAPPLVVLFYTNIYPSELGGFVRIRRENIMWHPERKSVSIVLGSKRFDVEIPQTNRLRDAGQSQSGGLAGCAVGEAISTSWANPSREIR